MPRIVCICPTYKRPALLSNVIACFNRQTHQNRFLVILDDADQYDPQHNADEKWAMVVHKQRHPTLPYKFNSLIAMARNIGADIVAIWEDDDIYLSNHLECIASQYQKGEDQFFAPVRVWSTYNQPKGKAIIEGAAGRFHASWAYSMARIDHWGGYPDTNKLNYDQQMHALSAMLCDGITHYDNEKTPTYVYRWGNGVYHGSQAGEQGYKHLWDTLGNLPAPRVERIIPTLDDQTKMIIENCEKAIG